MLDDDAKRGYVLSRSYPERCVVSGAAAIRDTTGDAVAAINITAAENSTAAVALEGTIKDDVVETALTVSSWLGAITHASVK